LERTEFSWPGAEAEPPEEMLRLVRGIVRRAELSPVVKLVTSRRRFAIHGPTGPCLRACAAGELVMMQRREQAPLGRRGPEIWDRLATKRLRRWLR